MPRFHLMSFAAAIMFLMGGGNLAYGVNINPRSAIAPASDTVLVRGGARGVHRSGAVAVRGPHGGRAVGVHSSTSVAVHGGGRAVVRGHHGGGAVAVRGPMAAGRLSRAVLIASAGTTAAASGMGRGGAFGADGGTPMAWVLAGGGPTSATSGSASSAARYRFD